MRKSPLDTDRKSITLILRFLYLIAFSFPGIVIGQNKKIDSLRLLLNSSKEQATQLKYLLSLEKEKHSLPADSILYYAEQAKNIAIQLKDSKSEAWADYGLFSHLLVTGQADSLLKTIDSYLNKTTVTEDRELYYKMSLLKANALNRQNKLNEAIEYQLQLLTSAQKENATETVLFLMNYIGASYLNLNKLEESKIWWLKAIDIINSSTPKTYSYIEATILGNLGLYYYNMLAGPVSASFKDSCRIFLDKSIAIAKEYELLGVQASGLVLKGNFLSRTGQMKEAEQLLNEGISIRKKVGDPFYILQDLINLGGYYYTIGQYEKSRTTINEGISLASKNSIKADRLAMLGLIAYSYKAEHKYEAYGTALEQFIQAADSVNKINSSLQLAKIQTKYNVQQKELQIAAQQFSLLKRKYLLYGSSILVLIGIIAGYIGFTNYRAKQKLLFEIAVDKEKKEKEIAVRIAQEKERVRIAADLHDNIGVQANAILYGTELLQSGMEKNGEIVDNLHNTAKEMLVNLRETLWAMNNSDLQATECWIRIINFCKQMEKHYSHIQISASGTTPPENHFDSISALHLMMIVKEAVNNSARHSTASSIAVTSTISDKKWQLVINDNGKGFDWKGQKPSKDSNGILNMTERAKAIGAEFSLSSENNKGTTISLSIPLS